MMRGTTCRTGSRRLRSAADTRGNTGGILATGVVCATPVLGGLHHSYVRAADTGLVLPHRNYGLAYARVEYVVIFDAEDVPEPD
jgi:hypothetical protein